MILKLDLIIFILLLLFAAWNGQTINWKQARGTAENLKWSKQFHRTGFIIRLIMFVPILFSIPAAWFWYLVFAYPLYNMIIASYMGQPLFYIGRTSTIDKYIPHWLHYSAYLAILAAAIYFSIAKTPNPFI